MNRKIILASTSPRRIEILKHAGVVFEAVAPEYEEDMDLKMPPLELAKHLAQGKAESLAGRYPDAIIIGADTFVVLEGEIFGKPLTPARATKMLMQLSGKMNQVISGFAVLDASTGKMSAGVDSSNVYLRNISEQEIEVYVATGEPLDKAGAYAIQGGADAFITKIEGDRHSIMGFPLEKILKSIREISSS